MFCTYVLISLLWATPCEPPPPDPISDTIISVEKIEQQHNDPYFVPEGPVLPETPSETETPYELTGIERRVAYCESGLRNVHNPYSTASGYFQFLDGTWTSVTGLRPPAADYSLSEQAAAFHELWEGGLGASHWQPSRYCWQYEQPWDHYDR